MKRAFPFRLLIFTFLFSFKGQHLNAQKDTGQQQVILIMIDGFGENYYRNASMPFLNRMEKNGIYKVVPSLMPAVTNVNNMAIATGTPPVENGITGNVYFDEKTQKEAYIEDPSLLLTPSLFQKAQARGIKTALLSVKKKTIDVLGKYADYTLCPECVAANEIKWTDTIPKFSSVYSREVNDELMQAAVTLLKKDRSIRLLYIHTTDYPMHTWPPENDSVKTFLHNLDHSLELLHNIAPDAAILITADHGLNHKSQAWDLEKALAEKNTSVKIVISPEKDRYMAHHRGLGGSAYVYLLQPADSARVRQNLLQLNGIDAVLSKAGAAKKFHLLPGRIGDLMVLGDIKTVFGQLNGNAYEALPATYRSHGSTYETEVPLFVFNATNAPAAAYFQWNYQLAAWLFGK